ncbi:unnamed protein product [Sphagnum jensenii]|uniref:Serine aminopeptidase S33 domain-containing protein n=1 Tax=Sphagnum jensenii TaxID=128206 RepID=A0ABP0V6K4_9BRYO
MKIWVILLTLVFVGCSTATPSIRKIAAASDPTEVLVSFVGANFNLNGTLTYPGQSSAFRRSPAVLLIPGSGPTNRDGNQPGLTTDLLKQISTDLARKGIASLRFDKRSVNSYSNLWPKDPNALTEFFSWENFLEDASQAYLILKNSKGIDPDQCSILGHSEGGLIASQIAARLNPPSLVLMATPGRPLGEVLRTQVQTLLAKQNASASVRAFYEVKTCVFRSLSKNRASYRPMYRRDCKPSSLSLPQSIFNLSCSCSRRLNLWLTKAQFW